jgi:CBS domain-containing protein
MSTVADLLDAKGHDVLTVTPTTSVHEAIVQMTEFSAGTAVVFETDKVVGIVSERDVIRKTVLEKKDAEDVSVAEIMSSNLTVVAAKTSIEDCMQLMTQQRIRHLPVMCGEKLCGIVSIGFVV